MALPTSITKALRLTRSGNLLEATAVLREALGGGGGGGGGGPAPDATAALRHLLPRAPSPFKAPPAAGAARPDAADTADRFEEHQYRGNEGTMRYRLYRPAQAADGMPLIVMLHGCTQSPEDFARGTGMNRLADEFGFLVAYPQQSQAANPQKCWNWFKPGDQRRGQGEPALLAAITREIIAQHRIDGGRVYVAGLSAGGAAAAIMAAEYPDLFAAVGIHSGLACGAARDLPSALSAMQRGAGVPRTTPGGFVPVITFHGDRDATVHEINSREIVAAATSAAGEPLRVEVEQGGGASGRSYTRSSSRNAAGAVVIEQWTVAGAGHAWAGGDSAGSYTDPGGPDASREMVRFFLATGAADRRGRTGARYR